MLRVLRPYTAYQHELDGAILAGLRQLAKTIEAIREEDERRNEREDDLWKRISELEDRSRRLEERSLPTLKDQVLRQRARIDGLGLLSDDLVDALQRLSGVRDTTGLLRERATPQLAGDPFERFTVTVGDVIGFRGGRFRPDEHSQYLDFEDLFGRPPQRVRELQLPYLGLVLDHQPVLDVACGRGEFLGLLAEHGIEARGIDADSGMIEYSRAQGLPVQQADAITYLEGLDDRTLGTVCSMHVIERLPVDRLRHVLALACHKLVPGGLMIAETINPYSDPAFKTFWVDPTHQHPIFPEVALAFCGLAGFESAYVFAPGHDSFEDARFESDRYAVVATAPGVADP